MAKQTRWTRDFVLVFLVNIFMAINFHMIGPTLPQYVLATGFTASIAGIVSSTFVISALLIRPASGYLCDTISARRLLLISLVFISLAVAGYAFSNSVGLLIACRLLHGLGWGIATTAASTLAAAALPPEKLGEGIGVFGLATVVSTALAPNLGFFLVEKVGFTAMFLTAAAFPIVGFLLTLQIKVSIFPALRRHLPRLRDLIGVPSLMPATIGMLMTITVIAIISFLAVYAGELKIEGIGVFFTIYAAALLISKPFSGRLSDRVNPAVIIYPCLFLMMAVFVVIRYADSLWMFLVAAVLLGLGHGGLQPILQAWSIRAVGPERRGVGNSTFFFGLDTGMGIGSLVAGYSAEHLGYANMFTLMLVPLLLAAVIYAVGLIAGRRTVEAS